jgi:hypothetical protein
MKEHSPSVHYGLRNQDSDFKQEGRREIARAVLVHSNEDTESRQLLFELETYLNNRGLKEYTLYVYKMTGDDKRTKSRVTEKQVREDERGLLAVVDKGNLRELGQYTYEFSHYSPEERF